MPTLPIISPTILDGAQETTNKHINPSTTQCIHTMMHLPHWAHDEKVHLTEEETKIVLMDLGNGGVDDHPMVDAVKMMAHQHDQNTMDTMVFTKRLMGVQVKQNMQNTLKTSTRNWWNVPHASKMTT